jgi:hypothetical protein
MPKYKAIIQLEDGRSQVVYQEANNTNEANQILSSMYKQDVQSVVVFDDLDRQSNHALKEREGGEAPVVKLIDDAKNIWIGIPITTWNEAVQLLVASAIMIVALLVFAFLVGIVRR